jgi:hypothetical protein
MTSSPRPPSGPLVRGPKTRNLERSVPMAVDQKILDVLKLSDLKPKFPSNPRVVDIRVEDYVDTSKDALRIWVILDESVKVEKLRAEDTTALKTVIRNRIRELGVELWPYVKLVKQSELDEEDEE